MLQRSKVVLGRGLLAVTLASAGAHAAEPTAQAEVSVYAAGSLRAALTDAARAFEAAEPGLRVRFTFGASGLLKVRLAAGERADLFASANMEHPQALADAGLAAPVQRFTRNALCALVAPGVEVSSQTLVERLLGPAIKLGTSTPKADPAGDYAWQMFERIEQQGRPGALEALAAKALQLTGGPQSPPPPTDRNVYAMLVSQRQADIFITYCTNAVLAIREVPALRRVEVPAAINVNASYGLSVLSGASPAAPRFAGFLLSEAGQSVLARHGFATRD